VACLEGITEQPKNAVRAGEVARTAKGEHRESPEHDSSDQVRTTAVVDPERSRFLHPLEKTSRVSIASAIHGGREA
jgi:hypothetical protein